MTCLVQLDRVTVKINKKVILQNVSLNLYKGECTAIVGSSGSGKSSLALTILGLLPLTAGKIFFHSSQTLPKAKLAQIIWQDIQGSLNPSLPVHSILSESLKIIGGYSNKDLKQAMHAVLQAVNLPLNILPIKPRKLSGGQQQRVAIAKALICHPELLICDEPLSALDSLNQSIILDLFHKIKHSTQSTLLFITHDIAAAYSLADRIVVLDDGMIVENSRKDEIFSNPQHNKTKKLLEAVPVFSLYKAYLSEETPQHALC